jgi:Tfp pilus assembly protein PilV
MSRLSTLRDERGMTLIEVMFAALVLVVGILATLAVFSSAEMVTTKSEREVQAADFAQQQVEQLRSLPYSAVALNASTADATWTAIKTVGDAKYVVPSPLGTEAAVAVDAANGKIAPLATWEDNRMVTRGTVYRYVTWGDDPSIPGTQNFKRIVVAVMVTGAGAISKPIIASAVKPDPDGSNLTAGSGDICAMSASLGVVCPG